MRKAGSGEATRVARTLNLRPLLVALALAGMVVITAERVWVALHTPLWFDETWTGMIAGQSAWSSFVREVWLDVNAPLYYLLMRGWTAVFGISDAALRAPGLIAAALAALLPIIVRVRGLSFEARLTWAALICAWWGVDVFLAARCYGLLLALSTAQAIALAALIGAPSRRKAMAWCALATASILTHYYALFPAAVQGLMFLAVHRQRAIRQWPAAMLFAVPTAWMAWHAPRLAQYARADVAWHGALRPAQLVDMAAFTVAPASGAVLCALAAVLAAAIIAPRLIAGADRDEAPFDAKPLAWTALASLIATAVVAVIAMVKPSLTFRYLIPEVPGMLLGVVLIARQSRRAHLAFVAVTLFYVATYVKAPAALAAAASNPSPYGHALASDILRKAGVTDVVYIWDHPAAPIIETESLRQLGGFFFRRAGADIRMTVLKLDRAGDPNRQALAAAGGDRPGIIWLFNRDSASATTDHPPAISALDPRWSCRTIGDGRVGAVACWRR